MKQITVVLLKSVPHLGEAGNLVRVKMGYAQNFLIPKDLAARADSLEAKKILGDIKERKEEKERKIILKEEKKIERAEKQKIAKAQKEKLLKKVV